ncbi:MAG: ribosome small subunit-dependent GTPase A [Woeseiaceae bacterium]|nr:ribosome small subunit-dependent GTPase A [Woeseiaceae bacterium]NIP20168.1 ribosome small subunit-dependent GTPase A [Woeseiaceae bacterium]NIS88964.1 ribosome small subunit-dependent GTPase A [Woeseiaceae bacterium]
MSAIQAQVIATFSRRMRLRLADGGEVTARIKGKRLRPVCGDRVDAEPIANESDWLITRVLERDNALTRPNLRGQTEVLAANIDMLIAVAAATPDPDWFIIDRYLAAAEDLGVDAVVVFNKTDIDDTSQSTTTALDDYRQIGYQAISCSARLGDGMDEIQNAVANQTAIIVGQSGVGKSSMINFLMGGEQQKTADVSSKSGEGKHTTVNSVMLELPGGGRVIDSPGVRDFAPALESAASVIGGYREIEKAGHDCRFANCRHLREPGCAVKAAVETGAISARRHESYRRLLNLTEKLEQPT